jgi:hypothetical protein
MSLKASSGATVAKLGGQWIEPTEPTQIHFQLIVLAMS